jgi:hypothetical protein
MNQMGKFQRSWLLLKSSLSIIARNKQLLVFPVVIFSLTVVIVLTSVASQVYKGALYLYAAEGIVVEPYSQEMLEMAWKFKKS